jgi:RNA polymerase sigma-70 factor, ECF subfamily
MTTQTHFLAGVGVNGERQVAPKPATQPNADGELLSRAVHGDLDSYNQLVVKHQDIAYQRAFSVLGDPYLAEDAVQESFIRAYHALHTLRGDSFRAWLFKIVTNTAISLLRAEVQKHSRSLSLDNAEGDEIESPAWIADPSPSVEALLEQKEDTQRLAQIINGLPPIYREVLLLVDWYELDYSEAAQTLNVPLGTIRSRVARARFQVRRKLQEDEAVKTRPCARYGLQKNT